MRTLNHSRGVTLLELMTTLSAAALVLALGVPSFRGLHAEMQRNQVRYALTGAFSLARSEALRRGVPVKVCPSSDGVTCSKDQQTPWSTGWIVTAETAGRPEVLDAGRFQEASLSLHSDSSLAHGVTFNASGSPSATGALSYGDKNKRCELRLLPVGRLERIACDPESG